MTQPIGLRLPSFQLHPLQLLDGLLSQGLSRFVSTASHSLEAELHTYLFGTFDASRPGSARPFTDTPGVGALNHLLAQTADALVLGILVYSAIRTVAGPGGAPQNLRVVLPRLLVAVAAANLSLPLIQQGIDLNNSLCQVLVGPGRLDLADLPWSSPLSAGAIASVSQNLFLLVFAVALVLALVVLVLAYVVRYTLLAVLCASAPLAVLAWSLPETRGFGRQWLRLLVVSLFMQFGQLLVLRAAVSLAFARGGGLTGMLYSFAALYLMLRVPGALNAASHFQSSAEGAARRWSRAVRHLAAAEL